MASCEKVRCEKARWGSNVDVAKKPVKKILFLAANPQATSQLGLDEEAKKIRPGFGAL